LQPKGAAFWNLVLSIICERPILFWVNSGKGNWVKLL